MNSIVTKKQEPYQLPDGTKISIRNFLEDKFIGKLVDEHNTFRIAFVLGSGRMSKAIRPGYVVDALFLPEISIELFKLITSYGYNCDIMSALDADLHVDAKLIEEYNLLISGGPLVNTITRRIMERFARELNIAFAAPESGEIEIKYGRKSQVLHATANNYGIFSLMKNPWAADKEISRIILLCAGRYAIGTVAANRFLLDLIKDPTKRFDAKINDLSIPAHIIEGEMRNYEKLPPPPKEREYIGNVVSYRVITKELFDYYLMGE